MTDKNFPSSRSRAVYTRSSFPRDCAFIHVKNILLSAVGAVTFVLSFAGIRMSAFRSQFPAVGGRIVSSHRHKYRIKSPRSSATAPESLALFVPFVIRRSGNTRRKRRERESARALSRANPRHKASRVSSVTVRDASHSAYSCVSRRDIKNTRTRIPRRGIMAGVGGRESRVRREFESPVPPRPSLRV